MTRLPATASIVEAARRGGVVGAGGAGFPACAKLAARAEIVIANGAECEPLLAADQGTMAARTGEVLDGLELAMAAVGAASGVVAVKEKHAALAERLAEAIRGRPGVSLVRLGDFYPAGDEVILVHAVTGRAPPEGGLPLAVGAVVLNVTSLANLAAAVRGEPVYRRLVTVAGAVRRPVTKLFPIGTSVADAIAFAGGAATPDPVPVLGGPMMGRIDEDPAAAITKTLGGIIVLPRDHVVALAKAQDPRRSLARAGSSCCQCSFCTDLCPRYLVGHSIKPHLLMRRGPGTLVGPSGGGSGGPADPALTSAYLCSGCGLCGFFACAQGLLPFKVNALAKAELRARGVEGDRREATGGARPWIEGRRVPVSRLRARLDLDRYAAPGELDLEPFEPAAIRVPLKQHVGAAAVATVRPGDRVRAGQGIGRAPDGALGADVHAGISGVVRSVGADVEIVRG